MLKMFSLWGKKMKKFSKIALITFSLFALNSGAEELSFINSSMLIDQDGHAVVPENYTSIGEMAFLEPT
jgi:hypothetical protein